MNGLSALTAVAWLGLAAGLARLADLGDARLRIPASVLLVLCGALIALMPVQIPIATQPQMTVLLLAPLLFEGARAVDTAQLRADWRAILLLAGPGTCLATLVIALLLVSALGWPLATTLPFAALIAATDPVAVIATFRSVGLGGRLLTLVESESLLNDAVAATLLGLMPLVLSTGGLRIADLALRLGTEVGLALVIGLLSGGLLRLLGRHIRRADGRSLLHLLAAILIAAVSLRCHASAVLATVVAGLSVAADSHDEATPRDPLLAYGSVANAAAFLWIGALGAPGVVHLGLAIPVALSAVLLGRVVSVYALLPALRGRAYSIPMAYQHLLVAGSLRGALALVFVMPLAAGPEDTPFPTLLGAPPTQLTLAVVAASVVLQGLLIRPLLRRNHLLPG